jgi:hypothetical protein
MYLRILQSRILNNSQQGNFTFNYKPWWIPSISIIQKFLVLP